MDGARTAALKQSEAVYLTFMGSLKIPRKVPCPSNITTPVKYQVVVVILKTL